MQTVGRQSKTEGRGRLEAGGRQTGDGYDGYETFGRQKEGIHEVDRRRTRGRHEENRRQTKGS